MGNLYSVVVFKKNQTRAKVDVSFSKLRSKDKKNRAMPRSRKYRLNLPMWQSFLYAISANCIPQAVKMSSRANPPYFAIPGKRFRVERPPSE
jgi:hypothetical protein